MGTALETRTWLAVSAYIEPANDFPLRSRQRLAAAAIFATETFKKRDEAPIAELCENTSSFQHALGTADSAIYPSAGLPISGNQTTADDPLRPYSKSRSLTFVFYVRDSVEQRTDLQSTMNCVLAAFTPPSQQNRAEQTKALSRSARKPHLECCASQQHRLCSRSDFQ